MPPEPIKPGTSYDRMGDLRKQAEGRKRNQIVAIAASLAGIAVGIWILEWVLSK